MISGVGIWTFEYEKFCKWDINIVFVECFKLPPSFKMYVEYKISNLWNLSIAVYIVFYECFEPQPPAGVPNFDLGTLDV